MIPVNTIFVENEVLNSFLETVDINQCDNVCGIRTMSILGNSLQLNLLLLFRYSPIEILGILLQLKAVAIGVMFFV